MPLVLASSSPRRHDLLRAAGIEFTVVAADVDESPRPGESPTDYVTRVATDKAMAVVGRMGMGAATPGTVVLAADTTVDLDGEILAKPDDESDARRMLRMLSGRSHLVHTAVVGWRIGGLERAVVTTEVTFAELGDGDVDWYVGTGEPFGKAGAYALQGAAACLIAGVAGSVSNVVGLPMVETVGVLRACGLDVHR
jgi:septum formation protein